MFLTQRIAEAERSTLEGLEKAGFKLDSGIDKSGIARLYYTRGGGYYVDVGCSQLIIDGKIKIRQSPEGIKGFAPKSLVLADGTELEADVVVLATGYDNMRTTVSKALGDGVADKLKDVWDLDEEGELNAVCDPKLLSTFLMSNKSQAKTLIIRCGVLPAIHDSGTWVEIWPLCGFIPNSSPYKSKQSRRDITLNKLGRPTVRSTALTVTKCMASRCTVSDGYACYFMYATESTERIACQLCSRDTRGMCNVRSVLSLPFFSLSFGLCFLQVTRIVVSDHTKHVRNRNPYRTQRRNLPQRSSALKQQW